MLPIPRYGESRAPLNNTFFALFPGREGVFSQAMFILFVNRWYRPSSEFLSRSQTSRHLSETLWLIRVHHALPWLPWHISCTRFSQTWFRRCSQPWIQTRNSMSKKGIQWCPKVANFLAAIKPSTSVNGDTIGYLIEWPTMKYAAKRKFEKTHFQVMSGLKVPWGVSA